MARSSFFSGPLLPFLRRSPRHRRRPVSVLPMVSVMPGEDVWFLRFALAFLAHLASGGSIVDELTGGIVGDPGGRLFNYDHVRGGPLLWAPRLIASGHIFIGHTVAPGFRRIASRFDWWNSTPFCGRGYDYFSDGYNYSHVAVDLAPHAFAEVAFEQLDEAVWRDTQQAAVLLPTDPVEQAVLYFNLRCKHPLAVHNTLAGRRLSTWPFEDFLFEHALPSYAKIFITYQEMAKQRPGAVSIVPFGRVGEEAQATVAAVLNRLARAPQAWHHLPAAVALARAEHLAAVEKVLGRTLDWRRPKKASDPTDVVNLDDLPRRLHREARDALTSLGVEEGLLPAAPATEAAPTVALASRRARRPA